jgi:hypothetical protein
VQAAKDATSAGSSCICTLHNPAGKHEHMQQLEQLAFLKWGAPIEDDTFRDHESRCEQFGLKE